MSSPDDLLRRIELAKQSAAGMPVKPLPTGLSGMIGHPGILAYERKDPVQYENDQRRAAFLRALEPDARSLAGSDDPGQREIARAVGDLQSGVFDDSPYMRTGLHPSNISRAIFGPSLRNPEPVATGRNPMLKGAAVLGGLTSVPVSAGRAVADFIDPGRYPHANDELKQSANTMLAWFPEDAGLVPAGTQTIWDDYDRERRLRGAVPWDALDSDAVRDFNAVNKDLASLSIDRKTPMMADTFAREGMPPHAAIPVGALSEVMLDPFGVFAGGAADAVRLSRAGRPGAVRALGLDAGLNTAPAASAVTYDMLIRRLNNGGDTLGR